MHFETKYSLRGDCFLAKSSSGPIEPHDVLLNKVVTHQIARWLFKVNEMEANASRPHVIYRRKFLQAFEPLPPQDLLSCQQRNVQLLYAI